MRRFPLALILMVAMVPALVLTSSTASAATVANITVASSPAPTATDATLTWAAYTGAEKYRIFWSTSSSGMSGRCEPNCTVIVPDNEAEPSISLQEALAAEGQVVTPGQTYFVKVSAINSSGKTITGWQSTPATVDLVGEPETPPEPETIPATVQNIRADAVTGTDATILWDRVPTAVRYRVFWSTSASGMSGRCEPNCTKVVPDDLEAPGVSFADTLAAEGQVVTPGQTYFVKVSAINSSGKTITGWQSTPATVDLDGEPETPPEPETIPATVQNIRADAVTGTDATILWDRVPTAVQYRVFWSTSASGMSGRCEPNCTKVVPDDLEAPGVSLADTLGAEDQVVTSGQTYFIKVSAINSSGKTITGWQSTPAMVDLDGDPLIDTVALGIARIGNNFKASGTATAGLPGRLFALQYKSGSSWVQVPGTSKIEAGPDGELSWTSPVNGSKSYRIAGDAVDPTPGVVYSPTVPFTPGPSTLGTNVIYATTDSGGTPTKKGVDYTGTATLVSGETVTEPLDLETIAVRGNSSAKKDKKPYKLKFESKQKPFGMKNDKTWILLANYQDRTLVRSKVAWDLGEELGGLEWNPDSVFTELFLNGKYLGSYQLVQSIKIDNKRVDVDEITGQILEWDPHWKDGDGTFGFTSFSGQDVSFKDPDEYKQLEPGDDGYPGPDPEGLSDAKRAALKTKVNNFEKVLYGSDKKRSWSGTTNDTYAPGDPNDWTTYLDMDSAVDYYLAQEFTKDQDADMYRSNFFYTDNVDPASSDKFFMGPLWDFDRSAGAVTGGSTSIASTSGWWVRGTGSPAHNTNKIHWYTRLIKDPRFLDALEARWAEKRSVFQAVGATGVDGIVSSIGGSPTLGAKVAANDLAVWGRGGSRYSFHTSSYAKEIAWVKNWYTKRYQWMDSQLD